MIAHTQTIFGNADEDLPGNCMQAAVASLLDMPLDTVPHFALTHDWRKAVALWLEGRDKKLRVFTYPGPVRAYWEQIGAASADLDRVPNEQMVLAIGASHNGPWSHIVVWKAGQLVHDSHPNRRGLNGRPHEYWQIIDAKEAR